MQAINSLIESQDLSPLSLSSAYLCDGDTLELDFTGLCSGVPLREDWQLPLYCEPHGELLPEEDRDLLLPAPSWVTGARANLKNSVN